MTAALPEQRTTWQFRLYIAGQTPRSSTAFANLKALCEAHLHELYEIEIVDLREHPERAREDDIFAIPTVVRHSPPPAVRIIGDLSDTDKVRIGLQLEAR